MPIKVVIVGRVRVHREGLAALLRECPSIEVLGAGGAQSTQITAHAPATDVALIDTLSAGPSGCSDMVNALRKLGARIRTLAVGVRETASEVLACAAAGMDGYVPAEATVGDMVAAIERVVRGELACSPRVAAAMYQQAAGGRAPGAHALTARELQVAELIGRGCPTKEIARRLGVAPCTAKNHVRSILSKLQVHARGQAVAKLRNLNDERFDSHAA